MFGMSIEEVLLILVVVLVFMGPEKIPEAAQFMGKVFREVRKASNVLRDAVMIDDEPRRTPIRPQPLASGATAGGGLEAVSRRDPDPRRDVRVVEMHRIRGAIGVTEVGLQAASAVPAHREVYLHVPYDETI